MKIDYKLMRDICLNPIDSFESFGDVTDTKDGIYIYKDNGSKILGVAHLDTVLNTNHFHRVKVAEDTMIINAQLDDRLGVYALTSLLPSLGIKFDLLLTEGEEQGRSTAAWFESAKDYNWIFSFDRRGTDVVMYQYESKVLIKALESSKFRVGTGSMSDISFMEHLGVKCFNVGTGYHGEHSNMCYANMTEFKSQIRRFQHFYNHNKDVRYKHDSKYGSVTVGGHYKMAGDYSSRFDWKDSEYDNLYCYLCGARRGIHEVSEVYVCDACMGFTAQCVSCGGLFFDDEIMDGLCAECDRHARHVESE